MIRQPFTPATVTGGEHVVDIRPYGHIILLGMPGTVVKLQTGTSASAMVPEEGALYDSASNTYTDTIPDCGLLSYMGYADYLAAPSCVLLLY